MKKFILSAAMAIMATSAFAGGLLTNSNQNAAFLRNFSQEGQITLTSIYANPAGNVFLSKGWHISLNSQTAIQQRNISTTFPLFAMNAENHETTHKFKGEAFAPVVPSISFSYNKEKWSFSGHFSLNGGGGKCEFDNGLGSFESAYAGVMAAMVPTVLPGMVSAGLQQQGVNATTAEMLAGTATYNGYSLKSYMKGKSYYFGLQLGASYKFTDDFAGYLGARGIYATCNYNGFVNPTAYYSIPAIAGVFPGVSASAPLSNYGIDLNCDQTGFGITPIIGFDYKLNEKFNFAAKYEAPTVLKLKNKTELDINPVVAAQASAILGQFEDGKKVREDIPGILAFGAQYSPIEKVRLNASFKEYFDKSAKKYGNKQDLIDKNTWEVDLGAEWDCCKWVTISAGYQRTQYGLSDKYMNDLSFNLTNNSIGCGVRLHPSKVFNIDLGYMHTMYNDRTVSTPTAVGTKTDVYSRKNDVIGIGFNFAL